MHMVITQTEIIFSSQRQTPQEESKQSDTIEDVEEPGLESRCQYLFWGLA